MVGTLKSSEPGAAATSGGLPSSVSSDVITITITSSLPPPPLSSRQWVSFERPLLVLQMDLHFTRLGGMVGRCSGLGYTKSTLVPFMKLSWYLFIIIYYTVGGQVARKMTLTLTLDTTTTTTTTNYYNHKH